MMVKANGEYLDFDGLIEVERQAKLFEEISTTDGDYSYQFDVPKTSHNLKTLGFPLADNSTKLTYTQISCDLLSDNGLTVYSGYLRIEAVTAALIYCAFFSGNNNWFGLLSGKLSDIDFSDLDLEQNLSNLIVYANASSGICFPTVDNGGLVTRSYRQMKVEDFVAAIYVKTVMERIFQHHDIKIQGELLAEPAYNGLITIQDGKTQEKIDDFSCYVEKNLPTVRDVDSFPFKVLFQNDSVYPFFDGDGDAYDLANSKYVVPIKMTLYLEARFTHEGEAGNQQIKIYINGAYTFVDIGIPNGGLYNSQTPTDVGFFTISRLLSLEAGDEIEIYSAVLGTSSPISDDIIDGWLRITPIYLFQVYGNSVVPLWTQQKYVSNILRMFNVLAKYESATGILTFDLFDNIKEKPPIDLSDYISGVEVDYIDFISNYGKRNLLSYNEVDFDDLRDYNIKHFFKYAQGSIASNNEFLEDSVEVVTSDFSNPQSYKNPVFGISMERLNLITLEEQQSTTATSVTDASGNARFVLTDDKFLDGDLIRVTDSTNPVYNGDWVIETKATGYIELSSVLYVSTATCKITKLTHAYASSDDVYLLWNIPFYLVSSASSFSNIRWEFADKTEVPFGFFNLLDTGNTINTDYKQTLSFGPIESPFFYQRTMIQSFWNEFSRIVNDPVKLKLMMNLPYNIFLSMDFLRPITIKTEETFNLYYLNKISGYESSEKECMVELIKL